MKRQRVKHGLFQERSKGAVVFEISGRNVSYKGIVEKLDVVGAYVPKVYMHEKSWWCLLIVRPWMNRHTLFYGNETQSGEEAAQLLGNVQQQLAAGESIDSVVAEGFQEALVFLD